MLLATLPKTVTSPLEVAVGDFRMSKEIPAVDPVTVRSLQVLSKMKLPWVTQGACWRSNRSVIYMHPTRGVIQLEKVEQNLSLNLVKSGHRRGPQTKET